MAAGESLSGDQFKPLPMEEGLYYRSHPKGVPFGPKHAATKPINEPEQKGSGLSADTHARVFGEKPGYSAFWNPHHVEQYHNEMGWSMKGRKVVAFRGTPIGEGSDGEPRVMPADKKPEFSLSPKQFENRLGHTDNGYGHWNEHTWGEGPKGQMVDDGYRTLGG